MVFESVPRFIRLKDSATKLNFNELTLNLFIMAVKKESTQKSSDKQSSDPCWDGYKKEGMKTKGGKKVPNCVPDK